MHIIIQVYYITITCPWLLYPYMAYMYISIFSRQALTNQVLSNFAYKGPHILTLVTSTYVLWFPSMWFQLS